MPTAAKRINMPLSEKEKQIIIAFRIADKDVQKALCRFLGIEPIHTQYQTSNKPGQIIPMKHLQN